MMMMMGNYSLSFVHLAKKEVLLVLTRFLLSSESQDVELAEYLLHRVVPKRKNWSNWSSKREEDGANGMNGRQIGDKFEIKKATYFNLNDLICIDAKEDIAAGVRSLAHLATFLLLWII